MVIQYLGLFWLSVVLAGHRARVLCAVNDHDYSFSFCEVFKSCSLIVYDVLLGNKVRKSNSSR